MADSRQPVFKPVHRRAVLRVVAVGATSLLFLGRVQPGAALAAATDLPAAGSDTLFQPNLALAIDLSGTVHLTVKKVEMGQGAHLGLRSLTAVELDVHPDRITVIQASSEPRQGEILTGGSYTLAGGWLRLRPVAAMARLMLVRAAAARWGGAIPRS